MKIELIYPAFVVCLSLALGSASMAASDQGVELFNQGRFQEAAPVLEAESKKRPADASLHYYLGNTYTNLNNHANAVQQYNLAIKCEPNSTAAKYSKMALLNYIGNEPAQTAPPPNPDEHAHAQAMVSAVKSIRKQADEHAANNPGGWSGRGGYHFYTRPGHVDQSASNLEQLLDAGEGPSGVSLRPEGTNLYIRNYKTPESIYLRHKGLSAPQDKLVFDGKKPAEKPSDKPAEKPKK